MKIYLFMFATRYFVVDSQEIVWCTISFNNWLLRSCLCFLSNILGYNTTKFQILPHERPLEDGLNLYGFILCRPLTYKARSHWNITNTTIQVSTWLIKTRFMHFEKFSIDQWWGFELVILRAHPLEYDATKFAGSACHKKKIFSVKIEFNTSMCTF
jgi:hypothetical protein